MTSDHGIVGHGMSWDTFTAELLPDASYNRMFSKLDFSQESFAVDHFVDCHKDQPLDELRELLSSYLKKLRVSCLDLMNQDYSNFVHLSSTLSDLGISIEKVYTPLIKAYEDIQNVRSQIEESCKVLVQKIEMMKEIRRKILFIENFVQVSSDVSKMETRLEQIGSLDRFERRLVLEESIDILSYAGRFMNNNTIESDSCRKLTDKIIELLQLVKSYKSSSEHLTCPFEFLLQKKYDD